MSRGRRIVLETLLAASALLAITFGVVIGLFLSQSSNVRTTAVIGNYNLAIPSQILDRNGKLITEFFGSEKRDLVPLSEMPTHLIEALLTREDARFYEHKGFSLRGFIRAAWNIATGQYHSGGSTITQQIAGTLYADRTDISVSRKLKELWWALQLERNLTKNQILELYMNESFFGSGTHGVEAASQFYFGHSVRTLTLAESAMLVIQLASPARYSPVRHPETAKRIQKVVLDQMVAKGFATRDAADQSFADYWQSYDYTRSASASAYRENSSEAPYFTEYVRQEMERSLFGKFDYFRDGLVVHTTLDLDYQHLAQSVMSRNLASVNDVYHTTSQSRFADVRKSMVPIVHLLSVGFDLTSVESALVGQAMEANQALYRAQINPVLDVVALMTGNSSLRFVARQVNSLKAVAAEKTTVEGALITLDNASGDILAMVGGSNWETSKFNRAVDAAVQPGSAIKPLYYSAAISSGKFTPATRIYDGPVIFYNEAGVSYQPYNFMGEWEGSVLLRYALATSMNVPSLQVLDGIGFDAAIDRISRMLGMADQRNNERIFPRVYPLGLGISPVAPINMARAFAVFPNQGREVDPIAVRYIADRRGNIILEPEKELRAEQKRRGKELQIMSPQSAFVMVSLLESTVDWGTLASARRGVEGFDNMPMGGKTGTTQNWADAWTVGFSPYYTTAIWFGFDKRGSSLGLAQTGATAAGPVWAQYMKGIHKDLPRKDFTPPETGLVRVRVDAASGLLPTRDSTRTVDELFIAGTEPRQFDTLRRYAAERDQELVQKLQSSDLIVGFSATPIGRPIAPIPGAGFDLGSIPETLNNVGRPQPTTTRNPLLD
ncbi:MAG TPA: PBP1A family penicillin-binding protein [Spirochaetia bacterium]|nr:PBP1A family penicillin-binding protein [Spirochaetia bacterium]